MQFKYDTILFGDGSWSNLWTLKELLREYKMVSGLRVNLNKSIIYGIDNTTHYLEACSSLLGCKIENILFKFLGLFVGGNHRNVASWNPVINSLKVNLSSWKGRFLSIGGRVTLINIILTNMPSYQFSFCKVPLKVVNEIVAIKRKLGGNM